MTTDIQTAYPIAATGAAPNPSSSAGPSTQVISSDFETFLLMLTTQLENQDPLNPIESQDFAVQLATFSGVEQQVLTNDLIRDLKGVLGASDLAQLAGWVGMEARVNASVRFEGRPVDVAVSPDLGSDRAELVVRNARGAEVAREAVPSSSGVYSWAGTGAFGAPLPYGDYTLELVSQRQGEVTSVRSVPHYAYVTEARQGAAGVELVIAGGAVVSSENVSGLREPVGGSDN